MTFSPGRITVSPYTGPHDLRAMQDLATRLWSPSARWHPGDLAWGRFQHAGREREWPTARWHAGGRTLAWGWIELPGHLDLMVDPAHPHLADEVLTWFAETTKPATTTIGATTTTATTGGGTTGAPTTGATTTPTGLTAEDTTAGTDGDGDGDGERTVVVSEADVHLLPALARHGYAARDDGPFFVTMTRDLDRLPAASPPAGFRLRAVAGADVPRRVAVHRAAYHPSRVTEESYRAVRAARPYRPGLDWIAEAPDGTAAAFCLVWLDEATGAALIEPTGTAPAHRRLGLARAVCLAALTAARAQGATRATVSPRGDAAHPTPSHLYRTLGFRPRARTLHFRAP
ncbi:GNAT family N-acetyltransferase [Sphaerisporangium sp. TRM90804]|uniref:GNAT family N-acetyltransferase n=1 Tax=Sphaerisporangium sp. TRM90804 TaxID=3031113 RepID=UPI00244C1039|nr:GNAT family N-acetyltransferase [Sphaerisporangium sp. TRM90804]MDH2430184.1 GNAT family N-acetyltransferase [Sphaerisporangium sp. TRM90804]